MRYCRLGAATGGVWKQPPLLPCTVYNLHVPSDAAPASCHMFGVDLGQTRGCRVQLTQHGLPMCKRGG